MIRDLLNITDDPKEIRKIGEQLEKTITIETVGGIGHFYTS